MIKNVLITCGGGLQGATLIKELGEIENVSIYVIDSYIDNLTKYLTPFYYTGPPTSSDLYKSYIESFVNNNNIDYIIPATIYDLELLANLNIGTKVAVSNLNLLKILLNKSATYKWLVDNGLPSFESISPIDLERNLPVIGKDPLSWGGKGIKIIKNKNELNSLSNEELDSLLWTTFLPVFDEFSIDFCINFDNIISEPIVRRRIRVLGGFAVIMEVIDHNKEFSGFLELFQRTASLIKSFGGLGIFNMQILKSYDKLYISDINPRVGTSSVAGKYINNNLSQHLLELADNKNNEVNGLIYPKIVRCLEEKVINKVNLNHIEGIIFDLDDTLIPHKKWIVSKLVYTVNQFRDNLKLDTCEIINYAKMMIDEGKSFRLFDEICTHFNLMFLHKDMIEIYQNYSPDYIEIYSDVLDTIKYLSSKYTLCILTDNPIKGQKQKIELLPFKEHFRDIIYTDVIGFAKPAKEAFRLVVEKIGISEEKLVMVGDNFHRDIKGAINSGYSYSFQIERNNSLFNSEPLNSYELKNKFTCINNLKELSWYL